MFMFITLFCSSIHESAPFQFLPAHTHIRPGFAIINLKTGPIPNKFVKAIFLSAKSSESLRIARLRDQNVPKLPCGLNCHPAKHLSFRNDAFAMHQSKSHVVPIGHYVGKVAARNLFEVVVAACIFVLEFVDIALRLGKVFLRSLSILATSIRLFAFNILGRYNSKNSCAKIWLCQPFQ